MKLHVWVPEFGPGAGGIQTFSRLIVQGLGEIFPTAEISIFSKNDRAFQHVALEGRTARFRPFGWWRLPARTVVFFATLLWRALVERPELIVTTHINFSPAARAVQRLTHAPYLAVAHGIEAWEVSNKAIRRALISADAVASVSNYTRGRVAADLGMPERRIGLLPDTFAEKQFVPSCRPRFLLERYRIKADQQVVLTVARLERAERYKGYDQVLRALPRIRQSFPDVRYLLVGKGPDRSRVISLVAELGVEENVILAGYVPDHELAAHYNLCDVFAMPSKGEGFGIVFLEAMACGKPVIAGNKDGSADAVLNGELGVLVDPGDAAQIAEAICRILDRQVESRKSKVESQTAKLENEDAELSNSYFQLSHSTPLGVKIPEVIFHPEELRRRVIEAYGYEKFKERLSEILAPLLKDKVERLK